MTGLQFRNAVETMADAPTITRMLKIADPTIVPAPMFSDPTLVRAITAVKNSGALVPIAMNVAPATSSERFSFFEIISRLLTKYWSQILARR